MLKNVARKIGMYKLIVLALAWTVSPFASAYAQEWPTRPVFLVVPFAAGSGTDILGRIVAPRLGEVLGQQIIIENAGGAGGMTASARVAKAEPDGYTIVLGNVGTHAQNQTLYKKPLYDAVNEFEPAGLVADLPPVLIARPDFPASNLKEFTAYAKANQSSLQYGSSGVGSAAQLGCALLNSLLGLKITHVPYRGAAPAMQDLIASRIDYQCALLPAPLAQIGEKQVRAIAILTKERSPALPDLPSAHEQGLTNFDASAWHGLFVPKGTPAAIIKKLNAALGTALDDDAVKSRLLQLGATAIAPDRRSPDYMKRFVAEEIAKWGAIIKDANIQLD
jgi:tripartite-type tricarboxylate transporter receptor subunit TctC